MIEVHFLFMQDEWTFLMGELPREGESVTFAGPLDHPATDFRVSVVHWFMDASGRSLIPYVSLRKP